MSTFDKNMEKIFDVAPVEQPEKKSLVTSAPKTTEGPDLTGDLNDAYQQTKDNLQDLIDQGKDAMEEILQVAKAGQHPRAFEVYATLLKNVVDANKELLAVQKQMRTMDGKQVGDTKIDKAAIFVGTTEELNKMLKGGNQ
jgi:Terminase DNA packaging enzyme